MIFSRIGSVFHRKSESPGSGIFQTDNRAQVAGIYFFNFFPMISRAFGQSGRRALCYIVVFNIYVPFLKLRNKPGRKVKLADKRIGSNLKTKARKRGVIA